MPELLPHVVQTLTLGEKLAREGVTEAVRSEVSREPITPWDVVLRIVVVQPT